jgi:hypothetical protein
MRSGSAKLKVSELYSMTLMFLGLAVVWGGLRQKGLTIPARAEGGREVDGPFLDWIAVLANDCGIYFYSGGLPWFRI